MGFGNASIRQLINLDVGAGGVHQVRKLIRDNSGIALYRDGFRVQPYGDPETDWLNLDRKRVNNPTLRLSQNQVSGFVFATAEQNPGLRDQANRVGLIENPQYEDLRRVVGALINLIEERRYILRRPSSSNNPGQSDSRGLFSSFDLKSVREAVSRSSLAADVEVARALDDAEEEMEQGVRQVQEVLSRFSRLSSLGALVDVIVHEGNTALTRIAHLLRRLERLKILEDDAAQESLTLISVRLKDQHESLRRLFRSIEPLSGRKRGRPKKVEIQAVIAQAIELISSELEEKGVAVSIQGENPTVTIDEADIIQVVVNLVNNSSYWTSTVHNAGERKIQVSTTRLVDGGLALTVADNGPGVSPEQRAAIFDPYFTSRPDGMGLGLSITGSIVKDFYDGDLELLSERPLGGASFRAIFRKRVG